MSKVSIPSVLGGLLELPNGKVVKLESVEGFKWLSNSDFRSFRFEDGTSPYTCRKETVKGTDGYWYGYQRVGGKVTKRYIGKTSDLTLAKLIEVSDRFHALPKSHSVLPKSALVSPSELGNDSTTSTLPSQLGNIEVAESLDNSSSELLDELKTELAQLKADNERLRQELAESQKALVSCQQAHKQIQEHLEPAKLLNRLRQRSKVAKATLKDLEAIVALIAGD